MTPEEKPILIVDGVSYEVSGQAVPKKTDRYASGELRVMGPTNYPPTIERPILRRLPDTPSPEYEKEKVCDLIEAAKYALPAVVYAGLARPKRFDDVTAQLTAALEALEPEPEKRFYADGREVWDTQTADGQIVFFALAEPDANLAAALLNNLHESKGEVK